MFTNLITKPVSPNGVLISDVNVSSRWPSSKGMLLWTATATAGRCWFVFLLKVEVTRFFAPAITVLSHYVTVRVFWFAATNRCECVRVVWLFCLQVTEYVRANFEDRSSRFLRNTGTCLPYRRSPFPMDQSSEFSLTSAVLIIPARALYFILSLQIYKINTNF